MSNLAIDKSAGVSRSKRETRIYLDIKGTVQGIGFRPFIYRLAKELSLVGWVRNSPNGVQVELEGKSFLLHQFMERMEQEKPALSHIESVESCRLRPIGYTAFRIEASECYGSIEAVVLPDIAICDECRQEIFNPNDRRYRYPFTNCTNCGPRFSILESIPYDRANTTMKRFVMCEECMQEYTDPDNRRFHAQPNACPNCGPQLQLWDNSGVILANHDKALSDACSLIRSGGILALKGLGGFQLIVDAGNDDAVHRLRSRKNRPEKPLALMFPSLEYVRKYCYLSEVEEDILTSAAAPILLLTRKSHSRPMMPTADIIASENPNLGVMLPYTPLHHLMMAELGKPIVATSGNFSGEPICVDEQEALERLGTIADKFLVHDRPIARHADDSVVRVMAKKPVVLRSARGFAPTTISLLKPVSDSLAVGGHLKNAICLAKGKHAWLGQHIGNLDSKPACNTLEQVAASLTKVYKLKAGRVARDLHPDYASTKYAENLGLPCQTVQHHYAHVLSCMAEHDLNAPVLGVAFDGTGLGTDGTIWGGEFLKIKDDSFERAAHLREFRLPGGESAIREPRRVALGMLYEIYGEAVFDMAYLPSLASFSAEELRILRAMLNRGINAPLTSSAGRLFDSLASLLGLCQVMTFEGQAAMKLEFAASNSESARFYPFALHSQNKPFVLDWEPMVREIIIDLRKATPISTIAAGFHHTMTRMIAAVATATHDSKVVLTGGCFQNKVLTELTLEGLKQSGCKAFMHEKVPPNDGGLALGQIIALGRAKTRGT